MKNSKLISLLSAGALFASSFSGLMINGGVALAGAPTAKNTENATAVLGGHGMWDATNKKYLLAVGESITISQEPTEGKFAFVGSTDSTGDDDATLTANAGTVLVISQKADVTSGEKVTNVNNFAAAKDDKTAATAKFTAAKAGTGAQLISGLTADETALAASSKLPTGASAWTVDVVAAVTNEDKVTPKGYLSDEVVTADLATPAATDTAASKVISGEDGLAVGSASSVTLYYTLTDAAKFWVDDSAELIGDGLFRVVPTSVDNATKASYKGFKLGELTFSKTDRKRAYLPITFNFDGTATAGKKLTLTITADTASDVLKDDFTETYTVEFVEAEEPAVEVAALSALTADGTEVTTVEPGETYTIAAVDENGEPVDYDGADLTVDGPATFDAETFALTVVEDAEDGAEITLTLGEATATLTVEVSDVDPDTVEVEGLDEETGELVPGAEYDLAAKDKDGNDVVLTEDDLKDVDPAGAVSIVDGKLVIADDLEDGTVVSFTLGGKAFAFTVNAAAPVPAQIAPQLSALPNSARAWTRLNFTDCGPVRTWREEFGNYYQGLATVLEEVTVPVNEKSNELGFYYGIYNQQLNTAVDGFNTRIGVSRRADTNYYVTASSSNEGVAYTKEYEINNDYGFMRVYANGVGTATITVSLFYRTAAEVANQAVGTEVGSASVVVNLVAAPAATVTYVDEVQRNAVVLTSVKPEAVLYTQAIDGDFVASKNVKWYEADARLVQISDKTATDRITVKSLGRGNTLIYAVPEALVERFENAYNWWIANQVNNINTKWSRANALAYAYNNVLFNSIGGTGITQFQVTASGVEREMFVYEDDEWLTSVSLAQSDSKVVNVGLNDNDYAAGITATNVTFKVNGSVADEKVATLTKIDANSFKITGVAPGTTKITFKGEWLVNGTAKSDEVELTVKVLADGETPAEDVKKAGDPVKESGVVGVVNEDGKTVTVTDVTVVEKGITIPETVEGLAVTKIAPQVFKKTKAKHLYVKAAVEEIGKGAFKNSSLKKAYFYQPAALKTVGKNAFKKTSVKVVGVGAAFSDDAATALKKAGAQSVKNNATAK